MTRRTVAVVAALAVVAVALVTFGVRSALAAGPPARTVELAPCRCPHAAPVVPAGFARPVEGLGW